MGNKVFADQVNQLKDHFGWNNRQLADAVGVKKQSVGQWLNDGAIPGRDILALFHTRFGISSDWLLGVGEHMFDDHGEAAKNAKILKSDPLGKELSALLQEAYAADPKEFSRAIRMIRAFLQE